MRPMKSSAGKSSSLIDQQKLKLANPSFYALIMMPIEPKLIEKR